MKLYAIGVILLVLSTQVADDCFDEAMDEVPGLQQSGVDLSAYQDSAVAATSDSWQVKHVLEVTTSLKEDALSTENLAKGENMSLLEIDAAISAAPGFADSYTDKAAMLIAAGRPDAAKLNLGRARGIYDDIWAPNPTAQASKGRDWKYADTYIKSLARVRSNLPPATRSRSSEWNERSATSTGWRPNRSRWDRTGSRQSSPPCQRCVADA